MSLTCKVQVIVNNISEKKAGTVQNAIGPDNIDFPKKISLELESFDNKLVFNFQSEENMKKLIATIDEVLEHVQLALEVID